MYFLRFRFLRSLLYVTNVVWITNVWIINGQILRRHPSIDLSWPVHPGPTSTCTLLYTFVLALILALSGILVLCGVFVLIEDS